MNNTDYSRYEGRKLRTRIYKELSDDVSMDRLCKILDCNYDDLEIAMKKLENEGYIEGNPVGTALCWGCRWAYGQLDDDGERCSWASELKLRSEWKDGANYDKVVYPDSGERSVCVKKCAGFSLDCYKLEKKYLIAILLKFFTLVNPEAFNKTFFVKANENVFGTWLKLFNDFRELLDFEAMEIAEPENYDDLTEEDFAALDALDMN